MANQVSGLIEVAAEAADRLAITPAQSLHRAIAKRVFTAVGPVSAPVRIVHDGIAGAVYATVRRGIRGGASGAAAAVRLATGPELRPLSPHLVSAVNGLIGDRLVDLGNDLAIEMALIAEPARPGGRAVVFLHGLGESEELWRRGGFGERLRSELGAMPVYVRYNSGLPVERNGERLAELLDGLAFDRIDLVGHSMGGLVAMAAAASGRHWVSKLGSVVTLGTPHGGAPLAKAVHAGAWLLSLVPESRPLAEVLDSRSAGIRDLRRGLDLPLSAGGRYTFIAATVTREARHPVGWAAGDLLVRTASATAGRPEQAVHVGPLHHFDLLEHPLVYEQVRAALDQSTSAAQRSSIRRTR